MGTTNGMRDIAASIDDDEDTELELDMNDDDLLFDDLDEDEPDVSAEPPRPAATPGWRRIEMLRESKWLRSELADFDDYDTFGFPDGDDRSAGSP